LKRRPILLNDFLLNAFLKRRPILLNDFLLNAFLKRRPTFLKDRPIFLPTFLKRRPIFLPILLRLRRGFRRGLRGACCRGGGGDGVQVTGDLAPDCLARHAANAAPPPPNKLMDDVHDDDNAHTIPIIGSISSLMTTVIIQKY